jgi:RNA polymerase sigma factor (sigma-70 family)
MSLILCPRRRDVAEMLYTQHHSWLQGWLRKKLGCAHGAADIAQDTFLRLMASRDLLMLQEPRAFLTRTATRLLIDDARHKKIEALYLEELAAQLEQAHAPDPAKILEAVRALAYLVSVLETLPQKPREAFLMAQLEELGHDEIARRLSVSPRMVRKYLVQALVHCHDALEQVQA